MGHLLLPPVRVVWHLVRLPRWSVSLEVRLVCSPEVILAVSPTRLTLLRSPPPEVLKDLTPLRTLRMSEILKLRNPSPNLLTRPPTPDKLVPNRILLLPNLVLPESRLLCRRAMEVPPETRSRPLLVVKL